MSLRQHLLANLVPVLLVLSLALLSAQVSFRVRAQVVEENFKAEMGTLGGHPQHPQFQNRVFGPAILAAARGLLPASVTDRSVWYLARTLQAAIGYVAFYLVVLAMTGGRLRALFAVGLVTFAYLWAPMTHRWEHSSDFFDVTFTALIVALALAERYVWLLLIVVLAAMNRESAAFAGVVSICISAMRYGVEWRRFVPGIVYMVVAAAVVLGLRQGLSKDPYIDEQIGILALVEGWRDLLHPSGNLPMLLATLVAYGVVLRRVPRPWTTDQKALFAATVICAAITFVMAIAVELRVWLPCWTMLALLVVIGPRPQSDREWLLGLLDRRR